MIRAQFIGVFSKNPSFRVFRNEAVQSWVITRKDGLSFDIIVNGARRTCDLIDCPFYLNKFIGYQLSNDFKVFGLFMDDVKEIRVL